MSSQLRLRPTPGILSTSLGSEAVLLDPSRELFYRLNRTGVRFWELSHEGKSVDEAVEAMMGEFEVERSVLERDVQALVAQLTEAKLGALEP